MAFTPEELAAWNDALLPLAGESWYQELCQHVDDAYTANDPQVYPPREELFTALRLTAPNQVKCVIIGQDPYHEEGQAHGLSFSVHRDIPVPRSLKNIYKELQSDLGCAIPDHGNLECWAAQGVLMLNDVLTVYRGQANSHKGWGWERFTSALIDIVEQQPQPVAYILWGKSAQKKVEQNNLGSGSNPRCVIRSNHPSPLSASRGFFGSRPFSQVNEFLVSHGAAPIDWRVI